MTSTSTRTPIALPAHVARQRRVVLGLFVAAAVVPVGATVLFILLSLNGLME
ncbi:hypothetical protein [Streptomyces abikoensis]|uniref:hypothetical protein n=1 Tax=Streptomyces abikoensis TaxID=97398 RepID=UPI00167683C1|nr:hypothetical protein [Streptomyces abikoensis]GGP37640.1 hypothetical protein GCM10010214_08430 [Streptomyces abikoensis]